MIADLLDMMRRNVARTLDKTILVRRRTRSRTGTGGSAYTWATTATVAGRIVVTSNQEMQMAEKMGISATYTAILPHDVDVRVEDRLSLAGVEYEVTGVTKNPNMPVLTKATCALVKS